MDLHQYQTYTAEDFILDEDFVKLSKGHSIEGVSLEQLKTELPEKNKEIDLALSIINGLQTNKPNLSSEKQDKLLNNIFKAKKSYLRITLLKYAASILIIVGLGTAIMHILTQKSELEYFAKTTMTPTKNAELILANGKRVEINSKQSKIEYTADGTSVSLNDTSKLKQAEIVSEECINQVIVPYGKRSTIVLSDGSKVWLNSGSRLIYAPIFNKKNREVYLEGEGYFEVSKDKNRPFLVHTDRFKIKVLGTKFNVQAFHDEQEYNTTLVEGKISLTKNSKFFSKEKIIDPGQKATLNNQEEFEIRELESTDNVIAWIYGYLTFEQEDLISLAKRISRYYNVTIEVQTQEINSEFSGKLDMKESIDRVLDGLSTIYKTKYKKEGEKIIFYK